MKRLDALCVCKRKHPVTPAKTLCAYFRSKLSTLGIEKVGPIEEGAAAAAQLGFVSVRALVVVVGRVGREATG